MCAVLAGELSSLFTGWIYCLALPVCIAAADLRRAGEWADAAMAWCATLPAGTPFHGICRVHHVEVRYLRGAWDEATARATRACDELLGYDPRVAAEAFYVAGEIRLRRGDPAAAEEAFRRAHELGRDPQPGRARLLAAEVEVALTTGDADGAAASADELAGIADGSGASLLHAMAATARGAVRVYRSCTGPARSGSTSACPITSRRCGC